MTFQFRIASLFNDDLPASAMRNRCTELKGGEDEDVECVLLRSYSEAVAWTKIASTVFTEMLPDKLFLTRRRT